MRSERSSDLLFVVCVHFGWTSFMAARRQVHKILLSDLSCGLGIRLTGGATNGCDKHSGIFVRKVMHGGAVGKEGAMKAGDEVLEINGSTVTGLTNSRAVDLLRQAAANNRVEIIFAADDIAGTKFAELIAWKRKKLINDTFNAPDEVEIPLLKKDEFVRKIRVMKNHNGVGMTVEQVNITNNNEVISVLIVDEIVPNGSVNVDSRLREKDIVLKYNGVTVFSWKPLQLHSVFLREKLRLEPSFDIEYIPAATSAQNVVNVISKMQDIGDKAHPTPDLYVPMELTKVTPMQDSCFFKSPPEIKRVLKSQSNRRRLTLDQGALVKVSQLESALEYLGIIDPSPKALKYLRSLIRKDENDMVEYGEFVDTVKEVFQEDLSRSNLKRVANRMIVTPKDSHSCQGQTLVCDKAVSTDDKMSDVDEKLNRLSKLEEENSRLQKMVVSLHEEKEKLHESSISYLNLLEKCRKESATLRQQIERLHQYDGNMKLRQERNRLKLEPHSSAKDLAEDLDEMRTRASLVDCEYRKAMEMKKSQEEVIRHLLHFTTRVATSEESVSQSNALEELELLIKEARDTVGSVKTLLEGEELPYGWEEAVLPDGSKYFINHADRTTSWQVPREGVDNDISSNVLSSPRAPDSSRTVDHLLIRLSSSDSDTQDDL